MVSIGKAWLVLLCCLFWMPVALIANAFEVSPMRIEISPVGAGTAATINVRNRSADDLPIEVVVERRAFQTDGTLTATPDDSDFVVFPQQFVVEPGNSQAVRIQYIGDPNIEFGEAYVIRFNQLPIDLEPGQSGIQVIYSFGAAVYVEPNSARAQPRVRAFRQEGENLTIEIENIGTGHAALPRGGLSVRHSGGDLVLRGAELGDRFPVPVIAPQSLRTVTLQMPELADTTVSSVEFEPAEY